MIGISFRRKLFVMFFILLTLFTFRFIVTLDTLTNVYSRNVFRVGTIPWSDARGWSKGAVEIFEGKQLTGVPAYRPLYPLFLSTFFPVWISSYFGVIIIQNFLFSIFLLTAYYLLRNIKDRLTVILFLCLLSQWRIETSTLLMTENLGIYLLILCFAMVWRGLVFNDSSSIFSGFFLFGLSQAVRPWCVMCLVTVPILPLCLKIQIKQRLKLFVASLLFITFGFGLHPLAKAIFNKPGEGYINNTLTLFGQVVGGKGWGAIFQDPHIGKLTKCFIYRSLTLGLDSDGKGKVPADCEELLRNDETGGDITEQELNRLIRQRAKERFVENPTYFFNAGFQAYKEYVRQIPNTLGNSAKMPLFFLFFVLIFVFAEDPSFLFVRCNGNTIRRALIISIVGVLVFYLYNHLFWMIFIALGLVYGFCRRREMLSKFLLLYLIGILLSIPLAGTDGGTRVRIGSDVYLYLLAALGVSWLMNNPLTKDHSPYPANPPRPESGFIYPMVPTFLAVFCFICLPLLVAANHGSEDVDLKHSLRVTKPEDLKRELHVNKAPLGPSDLRRIWFEWPNPSFEKFEGHPAYLLFKYVSRDAVYFNPYEGLSEPAREWDLWPIKRVNFGRTITIVENRFVLFPNTSPSYLELFENREIIAFGKLITRTRRQQNATGFVLIVSHIGYIDDSGRHIWRVL